MVVMARLVKGPYCAVSKYTNLLAMVVLFALP
jgi:hypothetical protein